MKSTTFRARRARHRPGQQGVVLAVSLIMLMMLSILASVSVRGASGSEQIANQSRQRALAQQAAEAALRFCEQQVQANADADPATIGFAPEAAPVGAGVPFSWEPGAAGAGQAAMSNWDANSAAENPYFATNNLKAVVFAAQGDAALFTYFRRQPECMSQYVTPANNLLFVTTARGFGPDVEGKTNGNIPVGTEVWLQSYVTLAPPAPPPPP